MQTDSREVLICVENPTLAHALKEAVDLIGPFRTTGVVFDAPSLLRELDSSEVDVVMLDARIERKSEQRLLRAVGERYPDVKILYLVGWRAGRNTRGEASTSHHWVPIEASVEELDQALRLVCFGPPVAAGHAAPWHKLGLYAGEIGALVLILGFSAYLVRDLFSGEFLNTGYSDWSYHLYRLKSMQAYGFLEWTNDWGGGFPLWQSYQFVPHLITLLLGWLAGWSVAKAMVFVTGALFVAFRLIVYGGLRLSGFSIPAALVGSMLTLAMVGYYPSLGDFSLLWGVTLFPIIIFLLAKRGYTPRRVYLAALLIGLGVYIHPILFIVGAIALASHILTSREASRTQILNSAAIVVLAASFFWFPTLFGDKPAYTNEWWLSSDFVRSMFPSGWLGLSPSLLDVAVAFGAVVLVARRQRLVSVNPRLFATSLATLGVVVLTIIVTYLGFFPSLINLVQATRWTPLVGVLLAILGAFIAQSVGSRWSRPVLITLVIAVIAADGFIIADEKMPPAEGTEPESVIAQILSEDGRLTYNDRVFSDGNQVPEISSVLFGSVRTVGNYFGQGSLDILSPALGWLLFSDNDGSAVRTGDPTLALAYLKAVGATVFVVGEENPIAKELLPEGGMEGVLPLRQRANGFALFEVPGRKAQAMLTTPGVARSLTFPDVRYNTDEQNKLRDRLLRRFAQVMYVPGSTVPAVG